MRTSSEVDGGKVKTVTVWEENAVLIECLVDVTIWFQDPKYVESSPLGGLFTLYLLADKFNDATTANLVMDEIIRMSEQLQYVPCSTWVTLAYGSTVAGSPLRKLCRDYYILEATDKILEQAHEGMFPFQFLKDVLLIFRRPADHTAQHCDDCIPSSNVRTVNMDTMEKCHYHSHDDEHPRCP
jgi:hypothetical protein